MPELSLHHIDQISRDIGRQEIVFSHLLHDLIDHVCCDVESEMQKGLSFAEAYGNVRKKMGPRRLQEIQEETLYSVDTKYRYMKTLMKFSGVAGTIIFGTAALFKIQHWPGAGIMLTLGAFILAFIFLPSALGVLWKETHSRNKLFLFISSFLTGFFLILGTVFKIQHWPAAGIMLSLAVLFGMFFFIPSLLMNRFKDEENKSKRPAYLLAAVGLIFYMAGLLFKIQHWPLATVFMILGVLIIGVIVFPLYTWLTYKEDTNVKASFIFIIIGTLVIIIPGALINMNLQKSFDDGYYPNLRNQQAMSQYLQVKSNSFFTAGADSLLNPQLVQLHTKTAEVLALISNIELQMIQASAAESGIPSNTVTGSAIDVSNLSSPFNHVPVANFLLPGTQMRQELDSKLSGYKQYLNTLNIGRDIKILSDFLASSDLFSVVVQDGKSSTMITGLHSLELVKSTILTVELNLQSLLSEGR